MDEKNGASPNLIVNENIHYECLCCGYCCRLRWAIEVRPRTAERIRGYDFAAHSPDLGSRPPVVEVTRGNRSVFYLNKNRPGCVFLEADSRCLMHRVAGFDFKGLRCRTFPFLFVNTPSGVIVDISFVCPCVLEDRGEDLRPQIPALTDLYEENAGYGISIRTAGDTVAMAKMKELSWEEYLVIEKFLDRVLSSSYPIRVRLLAAMESLVSLLEAREAAFGDFSLERTLDRLSSGLLEGSAGRLDSAKRERWLRAVSSIIFTGILESNGKVSAVGRIINFLRGRLVSRFEGGERIDLGGLRNIRFDADEFPLLERYFRHCLFRKTLALHGLLKGFYILILHFVKIEFYAKHFARKAGRDRVAKADLGRAVQETEVSHHHSTNLDELLANPLLRSYYDSVFSSSRLALALLKD